MSRYRCGISNEYVKSFVNKAAYEIYGVFCYGDIPKFEDDPSKGKEVEELLGYKDINFWQPRYIGVNRFNDKVPNPLYSPDNPPQTQIIGRWDWIEEVEEKGYVSETSKIYKDAIRDTPLEEELIKKIIQGFKLKYGSNFDAVEAAKPEHDWLSRAGIIIPPTSVSRGVIGFWHEFGYDVVIINPFIQDGLVIVNFKIEVYHNIRSTDDIESSTPIITYDGLGMDTGRGNMWVMENFDTDLRGYDLDYGDVFLYHVDKRASNDYY